MCAGRVGEAHHFWMSSTASFLPPPFAAISPERSASSVKLEELQLKRRWRDLPWYWELELRARALASGATVLSSGASDTSYVHSLRQNPLPAPLELLNPKSPSLPDFICIEP